MNAAICVHGNQLKVSKIDSLQAPPGVDEPQIAGASRLDGVDLSATSDSAKATKRLRGSGIGGHSGVDATKHGDQGSTSPMRP